jgi:hypothetical protein
MNQKEIQEYAEYLSMRHAGRINEQREDLTFFQDDFVMPLVFDKKYSVRTGYVAEMLNGITQQSISPKPRVFTDAKSKTKEDGADRIASTCNKWAKILSGYSTNPFEETFKNCFLNGETWIYLPHNEQLAKYEGDWQEDMPDAIPIHFITYDPTVVLSEPNEEIDGVPKRVVVKYERMIGDIQTHYPDWTPTFSGKKDTDKVSFTFYIDENTQYAEADKKELFYRPNIYKRVPFVHCYSGWGKETADRDPALLAFSRVRMMRDKILEASTISSNFQKNNTEFAWKHRTLKVPNGAEYDPAKIFGDYHPDPNTVSIVNMPTNSEFGVEETLEFSAPAYAYLDRVMAQLNSEYPSSMRGVASGTSGRQEDILRNMGLALYDAPLNNCSKLWARAFDMDFKICKIIPDMLPPDIKETDLESYTELRVDLKKEDPSELSRKSADGDLKYKNGIIDLETNLIEYQGRTKDEAKVIIDKMMADDIMRNDPIIRQILSQQVAKEMGAEDQYSQMTQQEQGTAGMNPTINYGARGGEQRQGNIKTQTGMEQAGMGGKEPRLSPGMAR